MWQLSSGRRSSPPLLFSLTFTYCPAVSLPNIFWRNVHLSLFYLSHSPQGRWVFLNHVEFARVIFLLAKQWKKNLHRFPFCNAIDLNSRALWSIVVLMFKDFYSLLRCFCWNGLTETRRFCRSTEKRWTRLDINPIEFVSKLDGSTVHCLWVDLPESWENVSVKVKRDVLLELLQKVDSFKWCLHIGLIVFIHAYVYIFIYSKTKCGLNVSGWNVTLGVKM